MNTDRMHLYTLKQSIAPNLLTYLLTYLLTAYKSQNSVVV